VIIIGNGYYDKLLTILFALNGIFDYDSFDW